MDTNLPLKTGKSTPQRLNGDEAAGPILKRLRAGACLSDMVEDYSFFTYAPLFLYSEINHNVVQAWLNEKGLGQVVYIINVDKQLLAIAKDRLNFTLWAVEKEYEKDLYLYISSIATINRNEELFTRVLCQEIPILDRTAKERKKLTITTFTPDTNKFCLVVKPPKNLTLNFPTLKLLKPQTNTVTLANALFANDDNPYNGVQKLPWEK